MHLTHVIIVFVINIIIHIILIPNTSLELRRYTAPNVTVINVAHVIVIAVTITIGIVQLSATTQKGNGIIVSIHVYYYFLSPLQITACVLLMAYL